MRASESRRLTRVAKSLGAAVRSGTSGEVGAAHANRQTIDDERPGDPREVRSRSSLAGKHPAFPCTRQLHLCGGAHARRLSVELLLRPLLRP